MSNIKKVIWAVDAFSPEPALERKGLSLLPAFYKSQRFQIEPTFVLSDLDISTSNYHPPVNVGLGRILKGVKVKGLKSPTTLTARPPLTIRAMVKSLTAHAHKKRADLIVAHTHSQSGISRMFLGSFAETLMFHSKTPLLLINPQTTKGSTFKKVLVPTDLSRQAFSTFKKVVDKAKATGASIVVYHRPVDSTIIWDKSAADRFVVSSDLKKYLKYAENLAVKCEVKVEKKTGNTAKCISSAANRGKCDVIAMHSATGPVTAVLVGSTTRQVVRLASKPVWII